jgi:tetratricopeptide (TPR) repeat protein
MISHGPAAAEECGRRAVELDPESELAWMIRLASTEKSAPDFVALCEASLRRFDHPQYRSELAVGYAAAGKVREAEDQLRHLLRHYPGDIHAHLQLAALYLGNNGPDTLVKGNEALTEAERLSAADPEQSCRGDAAALRAAFCALNGDANTARVMLETNLGSKEESVLAKALLDALPTPAK